MGINSGCQLCPRKCDVDRTAQRGFCGAPQELEVSAICLHRGEEPPIGGPRGIVNVFFAHCNLQCIYCQNHQISGRTVPPAAVHFRTIEAVADRICQLLPQSSGSVGFVTAAHYVDYIAPILAAVRERGFSPTVVYNSSGYESPIALRKLEGVVDIYLPDFKYMDPAVAQLCSQAADYPSVAQAALREMQRQVGAGLKVHDGVAYRGLVVRHLVLPGFLDNTRRCLRYLADEFPFGLHLSLMAQYFPPRAGLPAPLDRPLTEAEYATAINEAESLGLTDGWQQELNAQQCYRPDFTNSTNPF